MASESAPRWMRRVLLFAACYNVLWGAWVIFFPQSAFNLSGLPLPNYPELWQCIGMIVGVYGVGYGIASANPFRHWPIVLVGLLGKILGPIGFVWARVNERFSDEFLVIILFNDLVWWVPFFLILHGAYRGFLREGDSETPNLSQALSRATSSGESLLALSQQQPTVVVFLRHSGCTFCRLDLEALARHYPAFCARNWNLVVATMDPPSEGRLLLNRYGLIEALHLSDPTRALYRAFGLSRGTLSQLFGPRELIKGFWAAVVRRHGVGFLRGDGFQLGGFFIVDKGRITYAAAAKRASDSLPLSEACALGG